MTTLSVAGDTRGALAVLRRAGLLQDAVTLGAARLLPGDPDLQACPSASVITPLAAVIQ